MGRRNLEAHSDKNIDTEQSMQRKLIGRALGTFKKHQKWMKRYLLAGHEGKVTLNFVTLVTQKTPLEKDKERGKWGDWDIVLA